MRLSWTDEASEDIRDLSGYVHREDAQAAARLVRRIYAAAERLKTTPNLGEVSAVTDTRHLLVTNLPYSIIYRINSDCVEVLRVYHTRRRPLLHSGSAESLH